MCLFLQPSLVRRGKPLVIQTPAEMRVCARRAPPDSSVAALKNSRAASVTPASMWIAGLDHVERNKRVLAANV